LPSLAHIGCRSMHEQSETIKRADGKWINVYGRKTKKAGQLLPGSGVFDTVEEAVESAKERSKSFNPGGSREKLHPKKKSRASELVKGPAE
jgi:hypothetical protein